MRRVSIRLKLAAVLAVPLLGLVVVTGLEVLGTTAELREVREQSELALATTGPTGLLTALQNERAWPAAELVGLADVLEPPVTGYGAAWDATDAAIETFRADVGSSSGLVRQSYGDALAGLDELADIRADIDANTAPRNLENLVFSESIFARYSDLIAPFFDATVRIAQNVSDSELHQGASLVDTTARQIEVLAQLLDTLISDAGYSDGIADPSEITAVQSMRARVEDNELRLTSVTGPYAPVIAAHLPAGLAERVAATVDGVVGAGVIEDARGLAEAFRTPPGEGHHALQEALSEAIERRADELNGRAESRRAWFVGVSILTLALAGALVVLVSRSITRPLRSLTEQSTAMARRTLPDAVRSVLGTPEGEDVVMPRADPVRVSTSDEVADVADALNVVLDTALELAVEQALLRRNIADSFVNLGRRNQNLLGRQIDFITQLEAHETEPHTLANLFRLDHLATRMRRNAESLLVLAGVEPPRRWAAPVPVGHVLRAALSEVEDYQRVVVHDVEVATVHGSVAADLAHLLAELIENALVFSPAGHPVEVRGAARGDGYALAVIDSGPGMGPDALAAANRRLAAEEQFTVAPSRFLGHFVAGRLAARHGIGARLEPTPGTGVTALVQVPATLIEPAPPAPGPAGGGAAPALGTFSGW